MKINSIDIAAFGKFKNYHLDLNDSMTVIFGENEQGKSTIMAFIRMMFYGNAGKASGIDKNPRKKYRPWNSDIMAGSITFTHNGVKYRLEREFKSSNSTDKISLINLDLNTKQPISATHDIGADFFGITDVAFERSVFILESKISSNNDDANGEINSRLSNIAVTGDKDISFERVKGRLQSAKESLFSKSRKIGKCDKALMRIEEISKEIEAAKQKESETKLLKDQASDKQAQLSKLSAETSVLFDKLKNADKIKKCHFVEKYIEAEEQRQNILLNLTKKNKETVGPNFVSQAKTLLSDIEKEEEKVNQIQTEISSKKQDLEILNRKAEDENSSQETEILQNLLAESSQLDKKIEEAQNNAQLLNEELKTIKPIKKINIPILIIGLLGFLSGIALFYFSAIVGLVVSIIGLVFSILSFVLKRTVTPDDSHIRTKINENSQKIALLLEEKQNLLKDISLKESALNQDRMNQASQKALLESKANDLISLESKLAENIENSKKKKTALFELLDGLAPVSSVEDAKVLVDKTENLLRQAENSMERIKILSDNAGCYTLEEAKEKLKLLLVHKTNDDFLEEDPDTLKEEFKAKSDLSGKIRSELASLNAQIKLLCDSTAQVAVLERQKQDIEKSVSGYNAFSSCVDLAQEVLEESFREMRKNYSEVLDERTSQIFRAISKEKYNAVNVSKSLELNITTEEAFGLKESAFLSTGTVDQLYLALRLAVSELITQDGEPLPIFADDPLSQYDDARALKAMQFLKEYSKDRQVIIFTCHSAITDMAKELSLNIKNL